jgi:uncharacterized protein (DUF111 family)
MSAQMDAPLLILAQVDDATGEVLQDVSERLRTAGARNVQILASVGKKGRPAHVLLIDAPAQKEDDLAALLAAELGVWGYRVLESRHRHFDIGVQGKLVAVALGEDTVELEVDYKRIEHQGRLLAIKVEHDHLTRLRALLASRGREIGLRRLRTALEAELWAAPDAARIELRL